MATSELDVLVSKLTKCFDTKKTKGQHGEVLFLLAELKKLLHTLPEPLLLSNQEKLENLLYDHVMMQNGTLVISQLVAACLVVIYERGKVKFRYSFLIESFSHKDQDPRLGSLCIFGALIKRFGAQFLENMNDLISALGKVVKKDNIATKDAVLSCLVCLYEGMGGPSRQESETKDAILKLVAKLALDKSYSVRNATADCMQTIVICVSDATLELDAFIPPIVKNLKDPDISNRYKFAQLLGRILFHACQKDPKNAIAQKRKMVVVVNKQHFDATSLESALATISRFFAKTSNPLTRVSLSFSLVSLLQDLELESDILPKYVTLLFSFIAKGKPVSSEKFGRHSAFCLNHMIREGLLVKQKERGLETVARYLLQLIAQRATKQVLVNEYQLLVCLEQLGFIFNHLGLWLESIDLKDLALDALLPLLADSNKIIRIHTAQCLRQLGRVVPSRMATWLSMLSKVVLSWYNANSLINPESAIDNSAFCSLHGHIYALAALVSVTSESPDGVPSAQLSDLFNTAEMLVSMPVGMSNDNNGGTNSIGGSNSGASGSSSSASSNNSSFLSRQAVKEAGWTLLTSLIGLGQEWANNRLQRLFSLWKPLAKGPGKIEEHSLIHYLNLRLQSLVALRAFVCVFLPRIKEIKPNNGINQILRNVLVFANTTFKLVKDKEKERTSAPDVHRAFTSLTAVLLDIYAALPPSSYTSSYTSLLHFAVQEFTNSNTRLNTEIHSLLTPADQCLEGPASYLGKFTELCDFEQCALVNYAWNWCKRPDSYTHASSSFSSLSIDNESELRINSRSVSNVNDSSSSSKSNNYEEKFYSYHSHSNVSDCVLKNSDESFLLSYDRSINSAIRLFAAIFLEQQSVHQQQLTMHFLKIAKTKQQTPVTTTITSNVVTAILAVCREMNVRENNVKKIECAKSVEILLTICSELMSCPTPHIRRAVGESLGLLCRVEGEHFTPKVFNLIRTNLDSASKNSILMSGAAFALGCVIRYAGAMRTIKYQTFTVAALQALGLDFTEHVRLWVLHTLWLAVDTGGLSFASYMQPTLAILNGQCQHDLFPRSEFITQEIARVLHAVFAAMGPELTSLPTNGVLLQFLNLFNLIKDDSCSFVQVEIVNAMQQLLMWSSPALDYNSLLTILSNNAHSPDISLRRAVIRCVRGWVEKDSSAFFRLGLDNMLLRMLDNENEIMLIEQIQHAYTDCIEFVLLTNSFSSYSSPASPSSAAAAAAANWTPENEIPVWHLLDILKRVVIPQKLPSDSSFKYEQNTAETKASTGKEAGKSSKQQQQQQQQQQQEEKEEKDGDDDDNQVVEIEDRGGEGGNTGASGGNGGVGGSGEKMDARYETKVFAVSCIQQIVNNIYLFGRKEHFDLAYVKKHCEGKPRLLVQQVNDLVTVAGMAVTSPYLPLQVVGLTFLQVVIHAFENAVDPDGDNSLILELYQAQITSALRQTLSPAKDTSSNGGSSSSPVGGGGGAAFSPRLRFAACETAVSFIVSGALCDNVALSRIIGLILTPLEKPEILTAWTTDLFNDKVFTQISLAHIRALARLDLASLSLEDKTKKTSSSSRSKTKGFIHPKVKVLQYIREDFSARRSVLCKFYFRALKDFAIISTLSRTQASKMKGNFFDGMLSNGLREIYNTHCSILLDVCSRLVRFLPSRSNVRRQSIGNQEEKKSEGEVLSATVSLQDSYLYLITVITKMFGNLQEKAPNNLDKEDQEIMTGCFRAITNLATPEFVSSGLLNSQTMTLLVELINWRLSVNARDEPAWNAFQAMVNACKKSPSSSTSTSNEQQESLPATLVQSIAEFCCSSLYNYLERGVPGDAITRITEVFQLLVPLYQLSLESKEEKETYLLSPFIHVCLQYQRKASEEVAQTALVTMIGFINLYFGQNSNSFSSSCEQTVAKLSDELNQMLTQAETAPQFRVQCLLSSLLLLAQCCSLSSYGQMKSMQTVMSYCESSTFSRLALQIVFKVLLAPSSVSRVPELAGVAVRRVTPILAKLVRYPSEEELAKVEAIKLALLTFSVDVKLQEPLLTLWLPILLSRLPNPEVLTCILGLGQQLGPLFKAQLQLLSPQQRNILQAAVIVQHTQKPQQQQQQLQTEDKKKKKKKAEKESLSINFAKFT